MRVSREPLEIRPIERKTRMNSKEELSWGAFAKVSNGYLALANMKTEAY